MPGRGVSVSLAAIVLATLVAAVVAGNAARAGSALDGFELSKELAYDTYVERTGRVEVVIGAYLAGLEEQREFIPFQFAIGVWDKGPELDITLQDFELHDSDGNVYQAASPEDVSKHGLNQQIQQWVEAQPLNTGEHFATSRRVASNFYPEASTAFSAVHLDRETYLQDVIYFPAPKAGSTGRMMFSFYTKGMQEGAVNVVFEVPEIGKKKKAKD